MQTSTQHFHKTLEDNHFSDFWGVSKNHTRLKNCFISSAKAEFMKLRVRFVSKEGEKTLLYNF